jgi:hypothetical protein
MQLGNAHPARSLTLSATTRARIVRRHGGKAPRSPRPATRASFLERDVELF